MNGQVSVVGLCGSLRVGSLNRAALNAAGLLMPSGMNLTMTSWGQIPVFNADDQAHGWPREVVALGNAIRQADAILIASPEYNFSVPGGLKNALDWISRLPDQPFRHKPVAIMGASAGPVGTARMQYDLRKIMHFLEAQVLLKPEVLIGHAKSKFDAQGELIDDTTRQFVADQMVSLGKWVARLQRADLSREIA